ncbi:polymerase [Mesorhizobium sp. M0621]|uniref:polymerase n=1 Tax=Mesorhizobium sp. M0621 TaxID=2956974 RepID=UPI003336A1F9
MLLGEIIANTFATLLLICVITVVFFLSGKPLWPERHVRMVITVPVDSMNTAATENAQVRLPANFDLSKASPAAMAGSGRLQSFSRRP